MAYSHLDDHYRSALVTRSRGPFDLLVGPPGSGKSAKGRSLVKEINSQPHIKRPIRFWSFNLSRMSPIEFGYILIPDGKGGLIRKLPPHFELPNEGDIVEWTEFGRSHPQIQAAFIDIMSSGRLDGTELPWVFNYATSNDRIFRSSAMKDRFMVSLAPDPRVDKAEHRVVSQLIIDHAGLFPGMASSVALSEVVTFVIGATYDGFGPDDSGAEVPAVEFGGWSTRHVIGRIQQRAWTDDAPSLRVNSLTVRRLITANNEATMIANRPEYYIVDPATKGLDKAYLSLFSDLYRRLDEFKPVVQQNLMLNRILIERELSNAKH